MSIFGGNETISRINQYRVGNNIPLNPARALSRLESRAGNVFAQSGPAATQPWLAVNSAGAPEAGRVHSMLASYTPSIAHPIGLAAAIATDSRSSQPIPLTPPPAWAGSTSNLVPPEVEIGEMKKDYNILLFKTVKDTLQDSFNRPHDIWSHDTNPDGKLVSTKRKDPYRVALEQAMMERINAHPECKGCPFVQVLFNVNQMLDNNGVGLTKEGFELIRDTFYQEVDAQLRYQETGNLNEYLKTHEEVEGLRAKGFKEQNKACLEKLRDPDLSPEEKAKYEKLAAAFDVGVTWHGRNGTILKAMRLVSMFFQWNDS